GQHVRTRATVAAYCRHLKAALNWAVSVGLLHKAPAIRPPKQDSGDEMKGRPITTEEYERMLAKVAAALTPEPIRPTKQNPTPAQPTPPDPSVVASWQRFLTGLWWSGLRLGEAIQLSWDESAPVSVVMQPGYRPVFKFKAAGQKARRNELVPMAPEFAKMLEEIPEAERVGRVFRLPTESISQAGKVISRMGEKAGVVVNTESGKSASAHDLRRAFGTRWAKRVMPAILQRLMRHSTVQTTMKYYAHLDADDITADLWQAVEPKSNIESNSHPSIDQGEKRTVYAKPLPRKG
ncbi:MAG: site-specific integrase, partial [Thermoguttaceae bacterium]|nr:site-specific integrase [Thermoguttaceae bacterium]